MKADTLIKRGGMLLLALFVGYFTMIVGIFIAQEAIFGGVTYSGTPLPQLLIAGFLTTLSAAIGGWVSAKIDRGKGYGPALGMSGLVVLESIYMIGSGQMPGPVWFDVMAASSLVVGIFAGAFLLRYMRPKSDEAPSAA